MAVIDDEIGNMDNNSRYSGVPRGGAVGAITQKIVIDFLLQRLDKIKFKKVNKINLKNGI